MVKKIINFIILLILVVISNYADLVFPQIDLKNFFYTSIALTMCYLVFEIFLNGIIKNRIDDDKLQYSFKKTVDILFLTIFAVITLRIWIVNPR